MTDLTKVKAATISPDRTLQQAEQAMIHQGVRMLFVVDEMPLLQGLITSTDLRGERQMSVGQARQLRFDEMSVADVMTALTLLDRSPTSGWATPASATWSRRCATSAATTCSSSSAAAAAHSRRRLAIADRAPARPPDRGAARCRPISPRSCRRCAERARRERATSARSSAPALLCNRQPAGGSPRVAASG
jgi:hypothetical protein